MIFIITGEKDAGKSTYARRLVSELQDMKLRIEGFLSIGEGLSGSRKRFDLLDLAGARGGLLGLRGIRGEAADEGLQFGNLRLFLGVAGEQLFARLGGGGHIFVVVARIHAQLAVVQIGHVRAHAVQEVAIVRNDDHGAVARVEHAFQPANGIDV